VTASSKLHHVLASHPRALASSAAALWARAGQKIGIDDLDWARGLGSNEAKELLWQALLETGALNDGVLDPIGLQRLLDKIILGEEITSVPHVGSLVWTLPDQHPASKLRGRSLLTACNEIISASQKDLLITAPFIDKRGFGELMDELQKALSRGVAVTLLSHGLVDIGSSASMSIEDLRRSAQTLPGRFRLYSAVDSVDAPRADHPLLHAKLIIRDEEEALVSSANLTIYGLTSNFEVGVRIKGDEVIQLSKILQMLLSCSLTIQVANN